MDTEDLHESVLRDMLDPLTGRLREVLTSARISGERVAILLVHSAAIDQIDAMHGFHAGDVLSNEIVKRLRSRALRKNDVIEILSRDEFVCILRPISSEGVSMLAGQRVLTLLAESVEFGNKSAVADAAVGISMFPDHGEDAEVLLQRAKYALQSARKNRDKLCYFETEQTSPPIDQLQYAERLRLALDRNTLSLHFQPQFDVFNGRFSGAEALLRWKDDVLGQVPPNIAVQAAESAGLVDRLTLWVITSAIQQNAEFQKICPDFAVSVNISPSNLQEPDLPFYIDRALRTWGVKGSTVVMEITETAIMVDQQKANEALNELKSFGVRLSIDDFGTGYSSIYYLAQLPLDELKIDLLFVRGMLEVPNYAKIVRSLIELAHNLDMVVVAEGVENEEIKAALIHLGCDYLQGYHTGKPMPAQDLLALLRTQPASAKKDGKKPDAG